MTDKEKERLKDDLNDIVGSAISSFWMNEYLDEHERRKLEWRGVQDTLNSLIDRMLDGPESLARLFHDTYERLAPDFGYVTRAETRKFDPSSPNGKLMITVCEEVMRGKALGGEEE